MEDKRAKSLNERMRKYFVTIKTRDGNVIRPDFKDNGTGTRKFKTNAGKGKRQGIKREIARLVESTATDTTKARTEAGLIKIMTRKEAASRIRNLLVSFHLPEIRTRITAQQLESIGCPKEVKVQETFGRIEISDAETNLTPNTATDPDTLYPDIKRWYLSIKEEGFGGAIAWIIVKDPQYPIDDRALIQKIYDPHDSVVYRFESVATALSLGRGI